MKAGRTAIRYAKALSEVAGDPQRMREVHEEVSAAVGILEGEPGLVKMLKHPSMGSGQRAETIERIFKSSLSELGCRFLVYAARRGRLEILRNVLDLLEELILQAEGVVRAKIETAIKLDKKYKEKVRLTLERMTNKKIQMTCEINERLIGGIRIQVGDQQIDGTVRRNLETLREQLRNIRF